MVTGNIKSSIMGLLFSLRKPGSVRLGFLMDKVALGQVLLEVLRFSPVSMIPPWLSILISHLEGMNNKPFGGHSSET
jgi:hypothetical protein